MADKEEIIFSLKVEGSDALTEMERFKKSILQTKQEQQELTKAYKAGNVTLDEFVQDSVRLEAILKKQQSSYNNVQKSVTGVKTQLDKLIDSNKKISKSFEDTAREINVAGVSVGGLTDKLASFANPATAAVGIVGALATAYVSSTIGARDLAHAQDQLSTALKLSTNEFSIFVDELGGGDGTGKDGVLSRIANYVNRAMFGVRSAVVGEIVADVKRNLQELEIAEMDSKRAAKDALKIAEDLRRTRDRQDLDIQSRLSAAYSVEQFINQREQALVQVQQDKLDNLNALLSVDKENLELKKLIKIVEFEIADIQEDSEGKRTEALNGIITLEKELAKVKDPAGGLKMKMAIPKGTNADAMQAEQDTANAILAIQVNTADKEIETHAMTEEEKTAATAMGVKNRIALAQAESDAKVLAATMVLDSVARLASEGTEIQKAASLLSIAVSTTEAVTKGIAASQSVPFPGNLVAMATTIATVLGAIANAKSSLGFAEGGWTGPGSKFQPAGIVHADEYVVPKSIVHSPSAQHHLASLEAMRLRPYADGGLVTNAMTAETNQSLVIANSMKHMPSPEVSVVEVTRVQNKVKMKESAAKGKPFTR